MQTWLPLYLIKVDNTDQSDADLYSIFYDCGHIVGKILWVIDLEAPKFMNVCFLHQSYCNNHQSKHKDPLIHSSSFRGEFILFFKAW